MKISFLFGAGAESAKNSFDIPDGNTFLSKTLFTSNNKHLHLVSEKFDINANLLKGLEATNITHGFLASLLCEYILIYYEKNKCSFCDEEFSISDELENEIQFINKISSKLRDSYICRKYRNSVFSSDILNCVCYFKRKKIKYRTIHDFLCHGKSDKQLDDALKNLSLDILKQAYNRIKIDNKLDDLFHNLINPDKYNLKDYYKVLYYYWRCLFVIIDSIYEKDQNPNKKDFKKINDYLKYIQLLNKKEYLNNFDYSNSYYKSIKDQFVHLKDININAIVTTNYTSFVNYMNDIADVYLIHGNFMKYENSKRLTFMTLPKVLKKSKCDKEEFFPFIMGMSNVKPMINFEQVRVIYNAFKKIYWSDLLIIIGYGINENDNHITSFIKSFIEKKNKKIIYVTEESKIRVIEKLKLSYDEYSDRIKCINYFNKSTDEIINEVVEKLKVN